MRIALVATITSAVLSFVGMSNAVGETLQKDNAKKVQMLTAAELRALYSGKTWLWKKGAGILPRTDGSRPGLRNPSRAMALGLGRCEPTASCALKPSGPAPRARPTRRGASPTLAAKTRSISAMRRSAIGIFSNTPFLLRMTE
jgi:hypothetical protein